MFFAKVGYSVHLSRKGIWITAEDNMPLGILVLNLRQESILSLHCFSLSSSADVAFLAYPGETGKIKPLFESLFLVLIVK